MIFDLFRIEIQRHWRVYGFSIAQFETAAQLMSLLEIGFVDGTWHFDLLYLRGLLRKLLA
jgi:hypothetical protein